LSSFSRQSWALPIVTHENLVRVMNFQKYLILKLEARINLLYIIIDRIKWLHNYEELSIMYETQPTPSSYSNCSRRTLGSSMFLVQFSSQTEVKE
jgi:hypothetical protein